MTETAAKIHVCIGFYPNGDYVVNHVRDEDLKENVEYNDRFRPGRFYFVDGKHVCGGLMTPRAKQLFIIRCQERIELMDIKPAARDSRPYA